MKAYIYNSKNHFVGVTEAIPSPLEPGKFLFPENSTPIKPEVVRGKRSKFNKATQSWELEVISRGN